MNHYVVVLLMNAQLEEEVPRADARNQLLLIWLGEGGEGGGGAGKSDMIRNYIFSNNTSLLYVTTSLLEEVEPATMTGCFGSNSDICRSPPGCFVIKADNDARGKGVSLAKSLPYSSFTLS